MQLPKITKMKGMKALTISLCAAFTLLFAVIIIVYGGASKQAQDSSESTEESASITENDTSGIPNADPLANESISGTSNETSSEEIDSEKEGDTSAAETETKATEPQAPAYSLAFTSNGDGTCSVSGLGTYRSNEVEIPTLSPSGDIVTGIGKFSFYNCTSIVRVTLPSTLRTIGEYAFLGCSSLTEITVSTSNTAFKSIDGILYSRDGSRLICCPAMRGKTTCTLTTDVTVIECGAFFGVQNLKTVYYTGSAVKWTEINIYAKNELLDSVRLVCNYTDS